MGSDSLDVLGVSESTDTHLSATASWTKTLRNTIIQRGQEEKQSWITERLLHTYSLRASNTSLKERDLYCPVGPNDQITPSGRWQYWWLKPIIQTITSPGAELDLHPENWNIKTFLLQLSLFNNQGPSYKTWCHIRCYSLDTAVCFSRCISMRFFNSHKTCKFERQKKVKAKKVLCFAEMEKLTSKFSALIICYFSVLWPVVWYPFYDTCDLYKTQITSIYAVVVVYVYVYCIFQCMWTNVKWSNFFITKTTCQNAHRVEFGFSFSEYIFDRKHVKMKGNTNSEVEKKESESPHRQKEYRWQSHKYHIK